MPDHAEPAVSFVVVTHDRPAELVRSRIIASILGQRYGHKELILVGESCSQLDDIARGLDRAPELRRFVAVNLDRPANDDLCVWALVARARNAGIALCEGTFISCQDDDNELVPEFTGEMLRVIREEGAAAAWCWRSVIEPDGGRFGGGYFPWITDDEHRRGILYRIWSDAGILVPGSDVVRDHLWARRGGEHFATVDPNEWMAHSDVYRLVPFRERYSHREITYHVTFDDIWNEEFCRSGLPAACWRSPGLIYHLGGASNKPPPADDEFAVVD
jgi:Glycosyl transferase family 2